MYREKIIQPTKQNNEDINNPLTPLFNKIKNESIGAKLNLNSFNLPD